MENRLQQGDKVIVDYDGEDVKGTVLRYVGHMVEVLSADIIIGKSKEGHDIYKVLYVFPASCRRDKDGN